MPKIKRHYAAFCTGYEEQEQDFETIDQLMEIDWVKDYNVKHLGFYRFSVSRIEPVTYCARYDEDDNPVFETSPGTTHLMAEYNNGSEWWVVGYITDGEPLMQQLPEWEEPK